MAERTFETKNGTEISESDIWEWVREAVAGRGEFS